MNESVELRHLRYFRAVAEELHFGKAAKRLHMAQPPLSQQIRQLEEIIGHPLFFRSSRSVKLTPAGEVLLERARRTLSRLDEDVDAVRSVGRGEVGSLTVGFVSSAMLTPLPTMLGRYRAKFPKVQLKLIELYTSKLVDAIRDGSIDVGLLRDTGPVADLHTEAIATEPFVIVVPQTHRLANRPAVSIAQLRNELFVFFPRPAGEYAWKNTVQLCEQQGFQPNIVQEAPQWLTILKLVSAGLGVTIAPSCVQQMAISGIVCHPVPASRGTTSVDLTYRTSQTSPLVRAFCDVIQEALPQKTTRFVNNR